MRKHLTFEQKLQPGINIQDNDLLFMKIPVDSTGVTDKNK